MPFRAVAAVARINARSFGGALESLNVAAGAITTHVAAPPGLDVTAADLCRGRSSISGGLGKPEICSFSSLPLRPPETF